MGATRRRKPRLVQWLCRARPVWSWHNWGWDWNRFMWTANCQQDTSIVGIRQGWFELFWVYQFSIWTHYYPYWEQSQLKQIDTKDSWISFYELKQIALSKHTQNVNKEWNGPTPFLPGIGDDEFITTDAIRNIYTQVYDANQMLMGLENVDDHLTMLRKRFDFVDKVHVNDLYDWIVSIRPLVDELAKSKISHESKLVALLSPCENLPCASQPPTDSSMVRRSICYFL